MDGFSPTEGIIVIAATNAPDSLDAALTRPGRFDKHVNVPNPDVTGRKAILAHYLGRVKAVPGIDVDKLARGTAGCSGAELSNLVNVAALRAATRGAQLVTLSDLEYAREKILMGPERLSAIISDEAKKITAYHEVHLGFSSLCVMVSSLYVVNIPCDLRANAAHRVGTLLWQCSQKAPLPCTKRLLYREAER
jgi:ATP-dependent Zn protease